MSVVLCSMLACLILSGAQKPGNSYLKQPVPPIIKTSRLLGHMSPDTQIHLTVALRMRDQKGMQKAVDEVSNPKSPNYRHFMSPKQIGEKFGMSQAQFDGIKQFLTSHGFFVTSAADNRTAITASGSATDAEQAFGTTINLYRASPGSLLGSSQFYSYAKPLSVPSGMATWIVHVSGLDNATRPHRISRVFRGVK